VDSAGGVEEQVTPEARTDPPPPDLALSLVRDDPPFRALRAVGLIPRQGLGTGRRAVFFALLTWLPIAVWAALEGRALASTGAVAEPLLQHFGVHVRCLIAIPVLILAQGFAHKITTRLLPWFVRSGVVPKEKVPQLENVVHRVQRLRNAIAPWIVIVGVVVAWTALEPVVESADNLSWAVEASPSAEAGVHLGFGGWWFLYVARPVYVVLLLGWLWRVVLLTTLFRGIAKTGLDLVPTHPDRVGGLGFVERFATIFAPVAFALSAVLASHWGHQVMYHDLPIKSVQAPALVFLVIVLVVFLLPFFAFVGPLAAAKKRAELEYGALVGEHGVLVRRRWILKEKIADDELIRAPEIGPVADAVSLFDAVEKMRPFPIGKRAIVTILLPALIPILFVVAIKVPVRQILGKLLKGLV
jgi:hypothetical protein